MIRHLFALVVSGFCLWAAPLENAELQAYFSAKAEEISARSLGEVKTRADWDRLKPKYREELAGMLGLAPWPERTGLQPVVTGRVEREDFVVEKLHFQSMPGLYVTGNLYRPKVVTQPLPAILYLCGHGPVKTNGVSYGNKVAYQHHGAWFARHGYVCLVIDTIQLGEIEGIHHGTYREGMWSWNSRGYTPAGVEAWNSVRALDYLETRPEVDQSRMGVTGRSGGGAYSWWITAIDDRIKVSAPVAGITDLENHIVDGVVEGHCDCMFFVNSRRWDYPLLAALAAPRPLLICNSDKDTIFPLDGVLRTHAFTKRIYELCGAAGNLGLLITEGPHKDTQDLQVPVFRWFNRHLKGEDLVIEVAATKFFTPQELKVFDKLPEDERTSHIHESFVTRTPVEDLEQLRRTLRRETFGAWPAVPGALNVRMEAKLKGKAQGREVRKVVFDSESHMPLKFYYLATGEARALRLVVLDEKEEEGLRVALGLERGNEKEGGKNGERAAEDSTVRYCREQWRDSAEAVGFVLVRGAGAEEARKAIQVRRRYMLTGATLDGMRVWDIGRGVELLRSLSGLQDVPLAVAAEGSQAANALMYAAMAEQPPHRLWLTDLPEKESDQPDYLNFRRFTSLDRIAEYLAAQLGGKDAEEK